MTIPEYPSFFPCPTWAYQETAETPKDRSPFQCGWTRQRIRWPQHSTDLNLSFVMKTDQFDNWAKWMEANGTEWFRITIDNEVRVMRLTAGISYDYGAFDRISASAPAEEQVSG